MSELLKLSVSKTKTFSSCKAKYKYSYIEKLPKKDWEFFAFGTFLHKVLEDFHRIYLTNSDEPFSSTMSRVYKEALKEFGAKLTPEAKKETHDIIDSYLQSITLDKQKREKVKNILSVEKNFDLPIGEFTRLNDKGEEVLVSIKLNGMIDRIQRDDDGTIHVCDYKTTKNKKYVENDFAQLLTYAYAIYNEDPTITKVRGSYIMLRHNFQYITFKDFDLEQILKVKDMYSKYASDIENEKEFKPNPTFLCRYCDFSDICVEGKKTLGPAIKHGEVAW